MKRAPLYEQLKLYVRQLIADNAGKRDFLLPSEASLSQTFSVSRITAKRTLNDLEEAGLVVRKKGKGTYISPNVTRERAESLLGKSRRRKSIPRTATRCPSSFPTSPADTISISSTAYCIIPSRTIGSSR